MGCINYQKWVVYCCYTHISWILGELENARDMFSYCFFDGPSVLTRTDGTERMHLLHLPKPAETQRISAAAAPANNTTPQRVQRRTQQQLQHDFASLFSSRIKPRPSSAMDVSKLRIRGCFVSEPVKTNDLAHFRQQVSKESNAF